MKDAPKTRMTRAEIAEALLVHRTEVRSRLESMKPRLFEYISGSGIQPPLGFRMEPLPDGRHLCIFDGDEAVDAFIVECITEAFDIIMSPLLDVAFRIPPPDEPGRILHLPGKSE